jgi:hypothetical protein
MQNRSASEHPGMKPGEAGKHDPQSEKRKARIGETKATPEGPTPSPTPGSNEAQSGALKGGRGSSVNGQGEAQPSNSANRGETGNRNAVKDQEQTRGTAVTGTVVPGYVALNPLPARIVEIVNAAKTRLTFVRSFLRSLVPSKQRFYSRVSMQLWSKLEICKLQIFSYPQAPSRL